MEENSCFLLSGSFPRDILVRFLKSMANAIGFRAHVVDQTGNAIIQSHEIRPDSNFCCYIRRKKYGAAKCTHCYNWVKQEASQHQKPFFYRCHAGLVGWVVPILVDNRYMGAIVCNQVLMKESVDFFWDGTKDTISNLQVDIDKLKEVVEELPVMPVKQIQAIAEHLFLINNLLFHSSSFGYKKESNWQNECFRKERWTRLLGRNVFYHNNQNLESYSLNLRMEQELSLKVRQGDVAGTRQVLQETLQLLFSEPHVHFEQLRLRVFELLIVLSRAAIEGGGEVKEILTINSRLAEEVLNIKDKNELANWAINALNQYMEKLNERSLDNSRVVRKAVQLISQKFRERITVDEIAREVFVSPGYLCRLFRRELNCTMVDFLNRLRVEEAKRLLVDPKNSISKVALSVGFDDASYFSKVFRKYTGLTPKEYKKKTG